MSLCAAAAAVAVAFELSAAVCLLFSVVSSSRSSSVHQSVGPTRQSVGLSLSRSLRSLVQFAAAVGRNARTHTQRLSRLEVVVHFIASRNRLPLLLLQPHLPDHNFPPPSFVQVLASLASHLWCLRNRKHPSILTTRTFGSSRIIRPTRATVDISQNCLSISNTVTVNHQAITVTRLAAQLSLVSPTCRRS